MKGCVTCFSVAAASFFRTRRTPRSTDQLTRGKSHSEQHLAMGNIESSPEGSLGAVDSLKHRLQSLEEAIRSIEVGERLAKETYRLGYHDPESCASGNFGNIYLRL